MAAKTKGIFDVDVTKMMGEFKVPGVDVDALFAAQRRNMEAFTAANQCALEGVGAIVRRQSEIAREAMDTYTKAFGDMFADGTPEERVARNAAHAKTAYEQSVAGAKEIVDMATKTQAEAFGLINARVTSSFDEAKGFVQANKVA